MLDTSIYDNVGKVNLAQGLAGAVGNYYQQKNEQADRANKLAALAQQQELQGIQLAQAKEGMTPEAVAARKQAQQDAVSKRDTEYMRGVSAEIAAAPQNKDAILERHAQVAPTVGVNPEHITWLASDLAAAQTPEEVVKMAGYHALSPEEQGKHRLASEQAKALQTQKGIDALAAQTQRAADTRALATIVAGQKDAATYKKPLPTQALKMQQETTEAIATSASINADLGTIENQIDTGKLKLSAAENIRSQLKNKNLPLIGGSDENSRNYASFTSTLEKLRNDSLRLNKGVQTDGDAQRAWNELLDNINDADVVKQRLAEIKKINERGIELRKQDLNNLRENYGHAPLDVSGYTGVKSALGGKNPTTSNW